PVTCPPPPARVVVVVRGLVVVVDELAPVVGGRVVVLVVVPGGPVVVVVVVVVLRPRRRRLATSASLALAWPWQTARPSPLQRPSMFLPHARWAPRSARENVDVEPPFGRPGSRHSPQARPQCQPVDARDRTGRPPACSGLLRGQEGPRANALTLARESFEHSAN